MSIHIHDLKDLKLYRGNNKLFLPLDDKDNKHNSLIYLLTPNIESSINMINSPITINRNWFKSYYVDKSVNAIINNTGEIKEFVDYTDDFINKKLMIESEYNVQYSDYNIVYYTKSKDIDREFKECRDTYLHSKYQLSKNVINSFYNNIKILIKVYDGKTLLAFGVAYKESSTWKLGIYIDPDIFNDVEDRAEITQTIITCYQNIMLNKQYKDKIAEVYSLNNDKELIDKVRISLIKKGTALDNFLQKFPFANNTMEDDHKNIYIIIGNKNVINTNIPDTQSISMSEYTMNPEGIRSGNKVFFFSSDIFNEDFTNNKLRQYIYNDRMKTQKDLLNVYKVVKEECPAIKFTKIDYKAYRNLNLYFDISYYHNLFLEKNELVGERGLNLYIETLTRLLNNKSVDSQYTKKTIFIPVLDYRVKDESIFDYKKTINPISTMTRLIKTNKMDRLRQIFKDTNIIFFGKNSYFKINFSTFDKTKYSRFMSNINNILNNSVPVEDDIVKDTPDAIVTDIIDKLETSQKINLYGFTGKTDKSKEIKDNPNKDISEKVDKVSVKDEKSDKLADTKEVDKKIIESKKKQVVEKIEQAAKSSTSTEEALDKLNNDEYLSNLIQDIADEESDGIKASATRKARINTLSSDLKNKSVKGKPIKELINNSYYVGDKEPLPTTSIPVNSINKEQWENLQYINFNKEYDVDEDILAILDFFSTRTVPVGIRDINVEDTSTSEDLVETWTVQCEDISGTRFQLKFDIPKFKNNRLMRLRGNDKTINGQLMNLPILKTEYDTAQITTNYNKIFFYSYGASLGKSNVITGKLIKALTNYKGKQITYRIGSNKLVSLKYDVPMDYTDIGKNYSWIKYKNITFYFDQDEIRELYKDKINLTNGLPIGYDGDKKEIIYFNEQQFCSADIVYKLLDDDEFAKLFNEAKPSVKYTYSQASILNTKIPVIVICCYCEGLIRTLNKAKISFDITDKRPQYDCITQDVIRFKDGYLLYQLDYNSSLLMNGLKDCNTSDYSIKEINTKSMWTEMLDNFGGRIKADGLDNFYDLMFDPISIRTCEAYNLPSDFCEALIYASNLLADSKFNRHVDLTGNRFRTNEIVAGYTYKELSKSYADYRTKLKKTGKSAMTIKQSAIIDSILQDSTTSDASTINDLCYAEAYNTVSFKGLSGLNSDRSYSLEKRTYDDSMNGILGMSTGFAGTVGVTRQTTTNMNIQGKRGYIKDTSHNEDMMNDVNTMTIAENLTPMSTTHDDPFREAMSFIQRTKHDMRVAGGDPLLITNGMDDALTNFTPDYFSFNAKQDGKIVERDDNHIVVQYKDGTVDYIDLNNKVYKNSDGGFYTSIKLKPADKLGTTVKAGQLLAYDPLSYSTESGYDNNASYNQGTLAKIAIITSDKGYEDSCVVNNYISQALSSNVITQKAVTLAKTTNVYNLVEVGQKIQEGDPLLIIQNTFEDNDVNILLKNLVDDEETVTSLGRIPIKSDHTGIIEDIMIYRTCELDEMSPSLKKIVSDYEKKKSKIANSIAKYDKVKAKEYTNNYKLNQTGKLKNVEDGVLIEIYINYKDDFGIGDKLIILGAQKGVAKEVYTKDNCPRSSYRPDEPIDCVISWRSLDARMITAPILYTLAGKGLVELDRQIKDIMGIKQDYTVHHKDLEDLV